jgi:hypothetical protein
MLFDLRGRGRRRTVQAIYLGLAMLMGVGLIGFGVGGVGGGGLLNAVNGNEGSSSASFASQIKKYTKLTERQPSNAKAWAELANAQLHEADGGAYFDQSTQQFKPKGKELLLRVAQSWSTYLALNPPNPDPELAQRMLTVYGEEGLNQPSSAVQALQIVIPTRPPSEALYASLARYAYQAHNTREGDLAAQKAIALAPASERSTLKKELAQIKLNPTGATSSSSPSQVVTATTGASAPAVTSSSSAASKSHTTSSATSTVHSTSKK